MDSIRDLIEVTKTETPRLVVSGVTDEEYEALSAYFDRQRVTLERDETRTLDPDEAGLVLMRDGERIAVSTVDDMRGHALLLDEGLTVGEDTTAGDERPAVVAAVDNSTFKIDGKSRSLLLLISQHIESLAARAGDGVLLSGFQRLSRLDDDPHVSDVYRRLGDRGIEVHVYGRPDADPTLPPAVTLHGIDDPEVASTWLALHRGGTSGYDAALVCLEAEPGRYEGFWTFDPEVVATVADYVRTTWG